MNLNTLNNNYIYKYLSSTSEVKGIVHISHGKAEHIGRYKWLISMLNEDGLGCFNFCPRKKYRV